MHRKKISTKLRRVLLAVTVTGLAGALVANAAPAQSPTMDTTAASTPKNKATSLQKSLDALVGREKFPAALAHVDKNGRSASLVAGSSRLGRQVPVPRDGQVRAGSNTKTFTAIVVLQLVAEGRVRLDEPVETYLPGLVRGDGIDGRRITVRQLLQHTSGLPNYTEHIGLEDFEKVQHKFFHPHDLLEAALAHPAKFAPGAKWEYSNTNYLLAGLLVERVTERPVQEEITRRVIKKAGLRHTYWPQPGDRTLRAPHPHGYALSSAENGKVIDVTTMDPSWGGAAGQMISTPSDLARFARVLLDGKLLPPRQLAEMRKTVDAPLLPGWRYGLGVFSIPLSCGGVYWGHGGDIDGYETRGGATDDGRSVGVAVTALPGTFGDAEKGALAVMSATDTAFCT
ncbi:MULTISPECIES: serine hydrolase domain-containing protein [unclassified Streptomyces]|uniref:serine hydrolase domain-containing protein n=1 Tax=unclassified Streptomyces TaxID=2593676 RepID=UPI00081D5D1A|nr:MULTISPECIES: serine hydrolase domain-containing protein [unclassified Streptomyces]MYR94479.1 serine hydrolase [Streptomyces sp. SID4937]SCD72235.1 D-alanyl-D-alanine carboxypeptidase [Streptomyces sp. ScaeMP-e83]